MDNVYRKEGEFVVYERKPYAKRTTEVYRGTNEGVAVLILLDGD